MVLTLRPEEAGMNSRSAPWARCPLLATARPMTRAIVCAWVPFLVGVRFMRYSQYPSGAL